MDYLKKKHAMVMRIVTRVVSLGTYENLPLHSSHLWPYDYLFMRMGRLFATERLPNYQIKWWSCVTPNKRGRVSALLVPYQLVRATLPYF